MCTRSTAITEQSMGDDEHLCTRSSGDVERTTGDVVERTVDVETTNTAELLRAALEELRKMKEDRLHFQQREEELRDQLQRAQQGQSLPFSFCPPTAEIPRDSGSNASVNLKLKPDIFDGSVPLREYLTQFELIARANNWVDSTEAVALASNLRGKARSILDGVTELEH